LNAASSSTPAIENNVVRLGLFFLKRKPIIAG